MTPMLRAAMALSSIVYVVLCMHLPVELLADAGFDDYLFVQHGLSILSGDWLGPYSQMTLAKGAGYPLFLALNGALGVPITLSQALLYAGACLIMARAVFRLTGAAWLALLCLLLTQWHPALFSARVIRDDVIPAQSLLILAAFCHVVLIPGQLRLRLAWGAFGGLMFGWFWLTREDGIWILPGLALILLLRAVALWRDRREVIRLGLSVLAFATTTLATLGVIAAMNLAAYGSFVTVDFKTPDFEKALNVLQTVRVGEPVPYVPVPAKVRAAVDQVSPVFASLEPFFNGVGRSWTAPGCAIYASTCGDFGGGWFMWALRDGVAAKGHYSSPQAAAAFYRQIWQQVQAACRSGRLTCKSNLLSFMPAVTRSQWDGLPLELVRMWSLARWSPNVALWDLHHHFVKSAGDLTRLQTMERFLHYPRRTRSASERGSVTVNGWFHAPGNAWMRLRCTDKDGELILPVTRLASPDLAVVFHDPVAKHDRFSVTVPNLRGCALQSSQNGQIQQISLDTLDTGISPLGNGQLGVDDIRESGGDGQFGVRVMQELDRLYASLLAPVTILAIAVFILTLLTRLVRRDKGWMSDPVLALTLGIGCLLLARAGILVLVDISSFPAISILYWGAGFPLVCLADLLCLAWPLLGRHSAA